MPKAMIGGNNWYSRRVLNWRISNSMEAAFCLDCLEDALREHGKPEVLHFACFNNNLAQTKCTKNYKVLVFG